MQLSIMMSQELVLLEYVFDVVNKKTTKRHQIDAIETSIFRENIKNIFENYVGCL